MVWEQKTKAILMLNSLVERGAIKCHQYWPNAAGSQPFPEAVSSHLEEINLKVEMLSQADNEHFTVRICLLTDLEVCLSMENMISRFSCLSSFFSFLLCQSEWPISRSISVPLYDMAWLWSSWIACFFFGVLKSSSRDRFFGLKPARPSGGSLQCRHRPFRNLMPCRYLFGSCKFWLKLMFLMTGSNCCHLFRSRNTPAPPWWMLERGCLRCVNIARA